LSQLNSTNALDHEPFNSSARCVARSLRPRALVSIGTLVAVAGALALSRTVPAIYIAAVLCATAVLPLLILSADMLLLIMMLTRPLLALLPEIHIAGRSLGIDGILNLAMAALFGLVLPFRRNPPIRRVYFWVTAAFLFLTLLSVRLSTNPFFGMRQWLRFFGYFLCFWIAYTAVNRRKTYPQTFKRYGMALVVLLLGMGAAQMALLLRNVPLSDYVRLMKGTGLDVRLDGFQNYPHLYGNILMTCTPLVLWAAWTSHRSRERLFAYALAVACISAIVLTGVRSVFAALAAALAVFLLGTRHYKHLAAFVAIFIAMGLATGIFQARFDDLVNPKRELEWNSLVDRQEIWYAVDAAIERSPFWGYGLGSVYDYVAASPLRHGTKAYSTHCDYRKFAFEAGIPAAVLFAGMWLSVMLAGWRERGGTSDKGCLSAAAAAAGAGFLIIALVDEVMQDYASMTVYWTMAGVALGSRNTACREGEKAADDTVDLDAQSAKEPLTI
jgi:O-antigen ligase